jgi:hypothetical protein
VAAVKLHKFNSGPKFNERFEFDHSKEIDNMPEGYDTYSSMSALYADPKNVEGITYAKRWLRHEWRQVVEEQVR